MQLLIRVHVEFVVTGGQIYQTKTNGFQNIKVTPMDLLHLCIKKNIISMSPTLLKQRLNQNQHFGRLASKPLDMCRENTFD